MFENDQIIYGGKLKLYIIKDINPYANIKGIIKINFLEIIVFEKIIDIRRYVSNAYSTKL